jgi:hypothetical protein
LLNERQAEIYRAKGSGYTEEWIGRRVQTIETRKELTDEWQQRGIKKGQEYAVFKINNKGFEVQRLTAVGEWSILGFIDAKGKNAVYDFTDNDK